MLNTFQECGSSRTVNNGAQDHPKPSIFPSPPVRKPHPSTLTNNSMCSESSCVQPRKASGQILSHPHLLSRRIGTCSHETEPDIWGRSAASSECTSITTRAFVSSAISIGLTCREIFTSLILAAEAIIFGVGPAVAARVVWITVWYEARGAGLRAAG